MILHLLLGLLAMDGGDGNEIDPTLDGRPVLLCAVSPPLSGERLVEILRMYLDAENLDVRLANFASEAEANAGLGHRNGVEARVHFVLRVAEPTRGRVEIELESIPQKEMQVSIMPRESRDEDFYRSLAFRVQSLVRQLRERQSFANKPPAEEKAKPLETQLTSTSLVPSQPKVERRFGVQIGYTAVAFPAGGHLLHGVGIRGHYELGSHWRAWLGIRSLTAMHGQHEEVTAKATIVPLLMGLEKWWVITRVAVGGGLLLQNEIRSISASNRGVPVYQATNMVPGVGLSLASHVIVSPILRIGIHGAAIGILAADRYFVKETMVLNPTRYEVQLDAIVEILLW